MYRYIIRFLLVLCRNLKTKFINLIIKMFWFLPNNSNIIFLKKLILLLQKTNNQKQNQKKSPKLLISSVLAY